MARYTICGMIYSDAFATNGVPVNIVADNYLAFDDAKQSLRHFPAYRVICSAQEGQTVARVELKKIAKTI